MIQGLHDFALVDEVLEVKRRVVESDSLDCRVDSCLGVISELNSGKIRLGNKKIGRKVLGIVASTQGLDESPSVKGGVVFLFNLHQY